MNDYPIISIIVPVYNSEQYLQKSIHSIIAQTYKNLEIILVDDGSNDCSPEICDQLSEQDSRIKVIHKKNGGASTARNLGVEVSTGELIVFVDSDDILPENSISLLYSPIEKYPDTEIVIGRIQSFPPNDYYNLDYFRHFSIIQDNNLCRFLYYKKGKKFPVNPPSKLIKKSFLKGNNIEYLSGVIHEDEHWTFNVVKKLSSVIFVFDPTYLRYYREGSVMTSSSKEKRQSSYYKIIQDECENLDSPFRDLQLCKLLNEYFNLEISLKYSPYNDSIFRHFFKNSLKEKMFKIAFTLLLWYCMYFLRGGRILYYRLCYYSGLEWDKRTRNAAKKYNFYYES